jgi:hypothetical protein
MAAESSARVMVVLSPQVPLERLILARLQPLTPRARHAWLRSLLIEGLLLESRLLHARRGDTLDRTRPGAELPPPPLRSAPYTLSAPRFTGKAQGGSASREETREASCDVAHDKKPFAHLRRVIG